MSDSGTDPGTGHILIIDDEPYITDVLAAALEFEGFETEVAATGSQAIAMAGAGQQDLIVLDVMLP
ncbi:MAG: response regulator transcription factor, partial [Acidimicrobiales bacterium]